MLNDLPAAGSTAQILSTFEWRFNFRIVYQILVPLALLAYFLRHQLPANKQDQFLRLKAWTAKHWRASLVGAASVYFLVALLCKWSQAKALELSGEDYFLFEDMFHWMSKGFPHVTRFAGQAAGPLQHGVVHPFATLPLLSPLVWLFGSMWVAIALNPAFLALGGWLIGLLGYRLTKSPWWALGVPIAFWTSEWVGRSFLYETHPELAYPFFIVLAVLTLLRQEPTGELSKRIGPVAGALAAWILLAGFKEDAFVYCFVLLAWFFLRERWPIRRLAPYVVVTLVLFVVLSKIVAGFTSGAIGAKMVTIGTVADVPVTQTRVASGAVGSVPISGVASLYKVFEHFAESAGGFEALLKKIALYFVSGPFLLFSLAAPWIWFRRDAWILLLPPFLVFSMVPSSAGGLVNYYSMPLLGLFWLCVFVDIARPSKRTPKWLSPSVKLTFLMLVSAIHDPNAPTFYKVTPEAVAVLDEAKQVSESQKNLGIVSSRLLWGVDHERIWADSLPEKIPAFVSWILLPKYYESYEIPAVVRAAWVQAHPDWIRTEGRLTELFVRKSE